MNQSKAFLTSLIFAGLAMMLVYLYVSQQKKNLQDEFGDSVPVVVAAQDINELEEIKSGMLTTVEVPKKFRQPGSDQDPKTFEGSVAGSPFKKGEQVLLTKVLLKGAETGLSSQVAITRRAMSIPVSDSTAVTRLMRPGDRVDVIARLQYGAGDGETGVEIKTILQDVHVLAVGEMIQNNIPSAFEQDPVTGNRRAINLKGSRAFGTVTLEVTPQEAQTLVFVVNSELFLTLRNPIDRQIASVSYTTVDTVLGENSARAAAARAKIKPAAPPPPPPPPPPKPVNNPFLTGGNFVK